MAPAFRVEPLARAPLRSLAASVPPHGLASAALADAWPPAFVAAASLRHLEQDGGPDWCTTYLVVRRADDTVVGSACFKALPVQGAVEIGYGIAEAARGQGAATQAVRALVRIAGLQGLQQVLAEVAADNAASARVLQKAGFALVGAREDAEDGLLGQWAITPTTAPE